MLRFRFTLAVCSIMAVTSLGHLAIGASPDAPELNDVSLPEAVDDLPELLPVPATQTDASESATTTENDASEELEDATTEPVVAVEQEPAKQDAPKVSPEDQKGLRVEINKCKPGFPLRRISELNLDIRLKARADKDAALPPNAALCHFPKTQMHITGAETGTCAAS